MYFSWLKITMVASHEVIGRFENLMILNPRLMIGNPNSMCFHRYLTESSGHNLKREKRRNCQRLYYQRVSKAPSHRIVTIVLLEI